MRTKNKSWKIKNWEVLGHLCKRMQDHQDYATTFLTSFIDEDGSIVGDEKSLPNTVGIRFCPFCGAKLVSLE